MTAKTDSKPYGVVYCITNTVNGKKYIGQTVGSVTKRWKNHISDKTGCRLLKNAINKYGPESFTIRLIASAQCAEELNALEATLIVENDTRNRDKGYNLNEGGKSGRQHPETGEKKAAALRGRPLSEEHCAKLSASHMGHKRTKESLEKQSKSGKGLKRPPRTQEHIAKLAAAKTGVKLGPMTAEHKAKIGAANQGKARAPMNEEQKQKRSVKMIGKPKNWSAEGREKTLAASRAYWAQFRLEKAAQI